MLFYDTINAIIYTKIVHILNETGEFNLLKFTESKKYKISVMIIDVILILVCGYEAFFTSYKFSTISVRALFLAGICDLIDNVIMNFWYKAIYKKPEKIYLRHWLLIFTSVLELAAALFAGLAVFSN